MADYVKDIDAALKRLVDARRTVVPNLGQDDAAMTKLQAIQDSLVNLVRARDQESQLANGKSVYDAMVESMRAEAKGDKKGGH
jgi:hypothetical protein